MFRQHFWIVFVVVLLTVNYALCWKYSEYLQEIAKWRLKAKKGIIKELEHDRKRIDKELARYQKELVELQEEIKRNREKKRNLTRQSTKAAVKKGKKVRTAPKG